MEQTSEEKLSTPKKDYQRYQYIFNDFLRQIAEVSQGPSAITIVASDLNGRYYHMHFGPEGLKKELAEVAKIKAGI